MIRINGNGPWHLAGEKLPGGYPTLCGVKRLTPENRLHFKPAGDVARAKAKWGYCRSCIRARNEMEGK